VSTQFTVRMNVDVLPPSTGDYIGFQGYLTHTAGLTRNNRAGTSEIVWPDAGVGVAVEATGPGWYMAGALTALLPPFPWSTHIGAVLEVDYTCGGSTSTETVTMVHGYGSNTYLLDSNSNPAVEAGSESLTIECQAPPTEACCYPDGSCQNLDPLICSPLGGTSKGSGSACLGDGNGNGTDDACEVIENEIKWVQWPDMDITGLDVGTLEPLVPLVLADDFLCEQSGLITQIDFWASWFWDEPPIGDPNLVAFTLSLHSDVPAGVDGPYSHPGELLWEYWFDPGWCIVEPWASGGIEGWFHPPAVYVDFADTEIWFYQCSIPEPYWFQQEEDTVYWLDIQAMPIEPMFFWGWKTSIDHWNDASVWTTEPEPVDPLSWFDLWYPPMHPLFQNQIDLSFQIWGQECNPLLDSDGDTFADDIECYLPTDRSDDCTDNPGTPGLCPGPTCDGHDAWALDNTVDTEIDVTGDVWSYVGRVGATPGAPNWMQRLDIDMSGDIDVTGDVWMFVGMVGEDCDAP
jgi:hypothetical protein